ncbi:profilin [Rhodotorula toruloides]|uniref:Profilin n=1 Tax=Rhodotorula toruloides TaxID=5286 RepID=A0A511KKN5_RHOTO|nr:profilin [Rhodotorula toruloides]
MSWQAYVDTNLVGSGKVSKAAILGQQGGVWAQSAGYNLSQEEQNNLIKIHSDPGHAQANGVRAQGQKFLTIRADDRSVYGKKQADGIIVVKTKQAILAAEYAHPTQPGEATKVVEELADYLISVGY